MAGRSLRSRLRAAVRAFREPASDSYPELVPAHVEEIIARVRPYTMTSPERIRSLVESVDYVVRAGIPGAFVECGVWKGGSALAMLLALQRNAVEDRDLFIYDTFEGMPEPSSHDTTRYGEDAPGTWADSLRRGVQPWAEFFGPHMFSETEVRRLLEATRYPTQRLHVVKGTVETTLPARAPAQIALLRLDTDWYESTLHELEILYPRLSPGGVLIIDDYGHWDGCRRAVDEYFGERLRCEVLLHRIDYTGRITVKR